MLRRHPTHAESIGQARQVAVRTAQRPTSRCSSLSRSLPPPTVAAAIFSGSCGVRAWKRSQEAGLRPLYAFRLPSGRLPSRSAPGVDQKRGRMPATCEPRASPRDPRLPLTSRRPSDGLPESPVELVGVDVEGTSHPHAAPRQDARRVDTLLALYLLCPITQSLLSSVSGPRVVGVPFSKRKQMRHWSEILMAHWPSQFLTQGVEPVSRGIFNSSTPRPGRAAPA